MDSGDHTQEFDECTGWELMHQAHELHRWAYTKSVENPDFIDVIQTSGEFLRVFLMARLVWAAVRLSPQRKVSGRNSAIELLKQKIPRSTLYKFLSFDLGLKDEAAMDEFRECRDMEAVIAACPPLKELAVNVEHIYDEHRKEIAAMRKQKPAGAAARQ